MHRLLIAAVVALLLPAVAAGQASSLPADEEIGQIL